MSFWSCLCTVWRRAGPLLIASSLSLFSVAVLCLAPASALAQSRDDGFATPTVDGTVYAIATLSDGSIIIGGNFQAVNGTSRQNIAKLNARGELDSTFDPGANGTVQALATQAGDRILVGGEFTKLAGYNVSRLGGLDSSGGLDTGFNAAASDAVYAIGVYPGSDPEDPNDDTVWAGGHFMQVNGQSRRHLVRLDGTGGLDFEGYVEANNDVKALAVLANGDVLIGGAFDKLHPVGEEEAIELFKIAHIRASGLLGDFSPKLDGSAVEAIAVQGEHLLIGGDFTHVNSTPHNYIARVLTSGGGLDEQFGAQADNIVEAIVVQGDRIYVGGHFKNIAGEAANGLAALDQDGGFLDSLDDAAGEDGVEAIVADKDGSIIVANGSVTKVIAGMPDQTFNTGANNDVFAVALQAHDVLIGGEFTSVADQPRQRLARLDINGGVDAGFAPNVNSQVYGIAVAEDDSILIGGNFTQVDGSARSKLARLLPDGSLDASFQPNPNNWVRALATQRGGTILVGGRFSHIAGQPRSYLARLNADGTLIPEFNAAANDSVLTIVPQAYGKTLVGGRFTHIGGQPRSRLARIFTNGQADSTFILQVDDEENVYVNGHVYAIAVQEATSKVIIGGTFTQIGGQAHSHIARLGPNGELDSDFNASADDDIHTIVVQTDGKILIAGEFSQVNGQSRKHIARLLANGALDESFVADADQDVFALALQSDGKILAGGGFTSIRTGGQDYARSNIVRLSNTSPAHSDTKSSPRLSAAATGTGDVTLTWTLGGSAPDFQRTTFERRNEPAVGLAESAAYTYLGVGEHTAEGWRLSGLDLPQGKSIYIRLRGYYGTGMSNGSNSLMERVELIYLPLDEGEVTFVKVVQGGEANPETWRFDVENGPLRVAPERPVSVIVGDHIVTEQGPDGYVTSHASGLCRLADGQIILTVSELGGTCTLTNTTLTEPAGLVTFTKQVEGGSAQATDWRFRLSGLPGEIAPSQPISLTTGAYTVTESGPAGYRLARADGICRIEENEVKLTVTTQGGACILTNAWIEQDVRLLLPYIHR